MQLDSDEAVIAKFYRPGRWNREALQGEHDFMQELHAVEIPVIAPLSSRTGATLHHALDAYFALFPKQGGRICDEPSESQWAELGRLLARVHNVGSQKEPRGRITMAPDRSSQEQVAYILKSETIPIGSRNAYEDAAREILDFITPFFKETEYIRIPWRRNRKKLKQWQRGETGYPIVDAGMRELWTTGWIHNRVRMITASFLVKHLLIPWQEGARWFWDTLVDADLANNTLGWQWIAGCGADAAPYFRIFNPVCCRDKGSTRMACMSENGFLNWKHYLQNGLTGRGKRPMKYSNGHK